MNKSLFIIVGLLSIGLFTPGNVLATDCQKDVGSVGKEEVVEDMPCVYNWNDGYIYTGNVIQYNGDVKYRVFHGTGDNSKKIPHGKGTMTFSYKDSKERIVYDGEFKNGKKDGPGNEKFFAGSKLLRERVGNWKDGNRCDHLLETRFEGDRREVYVYNGDTKHFKGKGWDLTLKHGRGKETQVLPDGTKSVYDGEWDEDNKINGADELFGKDGELLTKYKGKLKNEKPHGNGKKTLFSSVDGKIYSEYTGEWKRGNGHGVGVLVSAYKGEIYRTV
jgi:hypothetical protein